MRSLPRIFIVSAWVIHVPLWTAFAANIGFREWIAGAIGAALAALATGIYLRNATSRYEPHAGDLAQAWRLPIDAISGTVTLFKAVYLQIFSPGGAPSELTAVPYDSGKGNAARALVETYTSATPDAVVLGVVKSQKLLIYHQILPGKVPAMIRKLGGGR